MANLTDLLRMFFKFQSKMSEMTETHIALQSVSRRPESFHIEVKVIIGKNSDRTPQRTEQQRICRAL